MDINPWSRGHTLVVPREHIRDLHEIGPDDLRHVMLAAQRVTGRMLARNVTQDGRTIWATQARLISGAESTLPAALVEKRWSVSHPRYPILMPLARLGCERVVLWNSAGAAAGQLIFHFHVHLIPRYEPDSAEDIRGPSAADADELAAIAAQLTA